VAGLSGPTVREDRRPTATAQLFRAKLRARRRVRLAWGSGVMVVAALGGYLLLGSPWLRVEHVRLDGLTRVSPDSVRLVTAGEQGRPMVLADTGALAGRLAQIPLVRSVDVVRLWPSTLVVTVHERKPAAAVPAAGGGFRLVDRDGVQVDQVVARPAALPVLQVDVAKAGAPALAAALDVLEGLPADLRKGLTSVGAGSPDDVWFVLEGSGKVVWGSPERADRKVAALRALEAVTRSPGARTVYDVSSPDSPAVSGGG